MFPLPSPSTCGKIAGKMPKLKTHDQTDDCYASWTAERAQLRALGFLGLMLGLPLAASCRCPAANLLKISPTAVGLRPVIEVVSQKQLLRRSSAAAILHPRWVAFLQSYFVDNLACWLNDRSIRSLFTARTYSLFLADLPRTSLSNRRKHSSCPETPETLIHSSCFR